MARPIGPTLELAASTRILSALEAALAASPVKARKNALRVLNRGLRRGRSEASRVIREQINLRKKVVDQRISTKVISERALVGRLAVRDRRTELAEYLTKAQILAARKRARARKSAGVSVKVYKKQRAKVYRGTFVELGTRSQKWHVLKREGAAQYPIRIQYGPRLTGQFEKQLPRIAEESAVWIERELDRVLSLNLELA